MKSSFNIRTIQKGKSTLEQVNGHKFTYRIQDKNVTLTIHKTNSRFSCWVISEYTTGVKMIDGGTQKIAMEQLEQLVPAMRKHFELAVNDKIEKYGKAN